MVPTQMNQAGRSMIRTTHRGSLHHHFPEVLTMRFLLQIYMEENAMTEAEREQCYVDSTRLAQELDAKGQLLSVNPLQPISTAATVRVRDGKRIVTDGPFAETREHLGGYFLVEAKDREEDPNRRADSGGEKRHRRSPPGPGHPELAGELGEFPVVVSPTDLHRGAHT